LKSTQKLKLRIERAIPVLVALHDSTTVYTTIAPGLKIRRTITHKQIATPDCSEQSSVAN
jgi:hypothetical protein